MKLSEAFDMYISDYMVIKNRSESAIDRHSFATNFLKNNGNIRYLSTMMGHASLDTTAMYAHVVDNDLKEQYLKYHSV